MIKLYRTGEYYTNYEYPPKNFDNLEDAITESDRMDCRTSIEMVELPDLSLPIVLDLLNGNANWVKIGGKEYHKQTVIMGE